ncbi:hypothetical protein MU1_49180 [Paenibacillus glycanilyticus]|uniref:Uncharacterized protein n=1 Tax=Paenibacillus glycanilyticus TaxID=126569 RepID=A0ABQ6GIQ1_9BACL|nr:hypothetical protein MU1_49180 [Paenibacillus glycanilyticus]
MTSAVANFESTIVDYLPFGAWINKKAAKIRDFLSVRLQFGLPFNIFIPLLKKTFHISLQKEDIG